MKKILWKLAAVLAVLLIGGAYYYVTIPAINIHSAGFWTFLFLFVLAVLAIYALPRMRHVQDIRKSKVLKGGTGLLILLAAVYVIGSILSSPIVNAKKYQKLITVESRDFEEDIQEADYSKIPLLDKDSATLLGNRKMGSMVDMVSQFEVSSLYTQINYQDTPVRVTPLVYASTIKWLTNQKNGIPAYIKIDMTTQNTELVKLEKPIRYSQSEYLNRNINRHLRFRYPTYIFDQLSFEIDDEGTPYWICPVKKYNIGLFGGVTIGRVVICNAQTGECRDYAVEDCPTWVDHVYSADLLIQLYDYNGTLKNGYFNSILGQKGCLQTTDGYNYLALEDDVWVYTGITSVSGDQSNVGFVLMNQRTMECRYYEINGAEEFSAMSSAEGQVQNLGYKSTFPLLLNVSGEPTYFMALKDGAGLVKKYAMVNIQKYQNVAIGDTVSECEKEYQNLLKVNGIAVQTEPEKTITKKIAKVIPVVIDGNSHFYLVLDGSKEIFDVSVAEFPQAVLYEEGDKVTLEYAQGKGVQTVTGIR
ncbi:MAG: CvpA family protein [Eubacteriales bacterium]|nr:CvpA family protein [Eubacteriales bacterium]